MYDVLIIGAGVGGYTAAMRAAGNGLRTAVIEKEQLGGTCLNRGCIPTKTYLHIAKTFSSMKSSSCLGIHAIDVCIDKKQIADYITDTVGRLRGGLEYTMKRAGVHIIYGEASLLSPRKVLVHMPEGTQELEAENIILATGSIPQIPQIPGLDSRGILTTDRIFSEEHIVPGSIVVIGGGVIGMEFAFLLRRLGSKVIVLEKEKTVLSQFGTELSGNIQQYMRTCGVELYTGSKLLGVEEEGGELIFSAETPEGRIELLAEKALIAVGRRPDYRMAESGRLKLEVRDDGRIAVDSHNETSVKGVFALGDAVNKRQLAYVAAMQGENVINYILGKQTYEMIDESVPMCIYMDPEAAVIGKTEEQAEKEGMDIAVGKYKMSENGRAVLSGHGMGYIKVIIDKSKGCLAGAELFCENAVDLIGVIAACMAGHMKISDIQREILPHPSLVEAVREAVIRAV